MKEAELKTALEEKEIARSDLENGTGNLDEALKEAREARDAAITRKGELELQLARVRIEVLQANSQLMEAVQQKVELSQQLEQWQVGFILSILYEMKNSGKKIVIILFQVDMQCLLDEQMKAKLTKQEKKRAALLNNSNVSGRRKILSLFR